MPEFIKSIHKTYKGYVKIISYNNAWTPTVKMHPNKKNTKPKTKEEQDILTQRSVQRARTTIHDIVACNTFSHFITLTVTPNAKFDRYNYDECAKYISLWLKHHLDKYILVPEKHKDGAYHFHLLANVPKSELTKYKGRVYNLHNYKYGYTTAIKITKGSEARIANYVRKYITKDLISTVGKGRRRYWATKNLTRPEVAYNLPVPQESEKVFETETLKIYHSPLNSKKTHP